MTTKVKPRTETKRTETKRTETKRDAETKRLENNYAKLMRDRTMIVRAPIYSEDLSQPSGLRFVNSVTTYGAYEDPI